MYSCPFLFGSGEVAGKTREEIEGVTEEKGLKAKGPDPKSGKGAFVDPVAKTLDDAWSLLLACVT